MCDYSLAVLPNRLAVEGEELIVHRFHTGSKGLAAPADLHAPQPSRAEPRNLWERLKRAFEATPLPNVTAVCIPPGAHLLLKNIPEDLQKEWRIGEEEQIVFTQATATENAYRDAVLLRHGSSVMLQNLREGMLVQVLSLGGAEVNEEQDIAARPY